jgi:hypothetical protein
MEDSFRITIYEPEMDMNRGLRPAPTGLTKLLFNSLRWLRIKGYDLGKPRRSVDREQQEYSPLREP